MKPVKLSVRLQTIADMIEAGSVVADIGTDHALLPVYLVEQRIIDKAYACDVAKGPLQRAKNLIHEHQLTAQIETILCDGLSDVPDDVDTVVIAGMGLDTIAMILEAAITRLPKFKHILIQSNSKLELLRTWIRDHHFAINHEQIVEDGHFYTVIDMNPQQSDDISDDEILFGKDVDDQAAFYPYWQLRLTTLQTILQDMPSTHPKYEEYDNTAKQIAKRITKKHVD